MTRTLALLLCLSAALHAQEDREAVRKTYEATRKSFVGLEIFLKKKTRLEKAELEEETLDAEAQRLFQLSENEQPLEAWGVAIEPQVILMADKTLKESDIERIRATDSAGATFEVKLHSVGRRHDFVLLAPTTPHELPPMAFGDWTAPVPGESFHVTHADLVDNAWQLNDSPYIMTNAPLGDVKGWFCMDLLRPGSVVSDKKGAPVGVALDSYLWVLADGRSSFLGGEIKADDRLADLEKCYEPLRKSLPAGVKRVEIIFRAEKTQDRYAAPDESQQGKTAVFGVAIDDKGTLFVPQDLSRDMVRKIEDLSVVEDGKSTPATFVGLFRAFGGFLVRAEGLKPRASAPRDAKAPARGVLFSPAAFEARFGRGGINLDKNRLFRIETGLAGAPRNQPRKRIKS